MIVLNETIRADLIVFIALFADLGTIAIAYDNAPFANKPVEWQLPKIWIISSILGALLAAATWILRGTLFLSNGGIIQNWGSVQEILFLEVALTEVSFSDVTCPLFANPVLSCVPELADLRDAWS
jgi:H+-transporting ATPase